jgi:hypothetical protein
MKDEGKMKIYYLMRRFYPIAAHSAISGMQDIIYAPNYGIIAKNPSNENEFFYEHNTRAMEEAQKIVDEGGEGFVREAEVDVDEFCSGLVGLGNKIEDSKNEFNGKAKSLFDRVKGGSN